MSEYFEEEFLHSLIKEFTEQVGSNVCNESGCDNQTIAHQLSRAFYDDYCDRHKYKEKVRPVRMPTRTKAQRRKRQLVIYTYTIGKMRAEILDLKDRLNRAEQKLKEENGNR